MVVFALYQHNGGSIHIIFAVSGTEKFTVSAKQNDSFKIKLQERNTGLLTFDPARWFEAITAADIASASTQTYQEQKILFIHKDFNTHLFQALMSRIGQSAELTILPGANKGF